MKESTELCIFLAAATAFSALAGKITGILAASDITLKAAGFLMGFIRASLYKIRFALIWAGYLLVLQTGIAAVCIIFRINPLADAGQFRAGEIIICTFAGFLFQFELSSMILLVVNAFSGETDWYRVITQIGWVSVSFNIPRRIRIFYPTSAALLEETFYRGCVFYVLCTHFPWVPVPVSAAAATVLFMLQQALGARSLKQAAALSAGSFAISVAGCFMTAMCSTVIPSIICHLSYVIFYMNKRRNK